MFVKSIMFRIFNRLVSILKSESRSDRSMWSGSYLSWDKAEEVCTGYDSDEILRKCALSILKVKNGDAVYERDSFIFDEIQYSWPLLAGLQRVALDFGGSLNVLDFGGSLGSAYFQNKDFLKSVKNINWNIIEQPNFVGFGQKHVQDSSLRFYFTIEDCLLENTPNVVLLSSVLQYLKTPYIWLEKVISLNIPYIIIDRTAFNNNGKECLTIQNVPKEIYEASYPSWFFNYDEFTKYFQDSYSLIATFDSSFENSIKISKDLNAVWKGFILKKIN